MTDAVHPLLRAFPVVLTIPVQWGEMDAYGHVNNTVLFRYFESARVDFLERCGFLTTYEEEQIGAILHSTACRFRRPLIYPDTIQVGGRATDVGEDRFTMEYVVVSLQHNVVAAEGTGVIVAFDYSTRSKAVLPARVRQGLAALAAT